MVYQLEESEILGEPLPARDNRRAILAYEATEGGAGVLTRLMDDVKAISLVARTALDLMHYSNIDAAIAAKDPDLLEEKADEACVRGCYRCLLSYFNQPDHEQIDRSSSEITQLLIDLACGETVLQTGAPTASPDSPWLKAFSDAGLPKPDPGSVTFSTSEIEFVWKSHRVAATGLPVTVEMLDDAAAKGWVLVAIPSAPDSASLAKLTSLLKGQS